MDILLNVFLTCLFIFFSCFCCTVFLHVVIKTPEGEIWANMSTITKFLLVASFWLGILSGPVWVITWIWS